MSGLISIAEYARQRGISDAAVHRAIKAGRIEAIEVEGRRWIHPDLADRQWRERTQHSKARRPDTASPALSRPVPGPPEADIELRPSRPPAIADSGGLDSSYLDARTRREAALAQLAELELEKTRGKLVDRDRVAAVAMRLGRLERDAILGLPTQLAPELAAVTDPLALEVRLTEALRELLADLARLTAQDLEGLLGTVPSLMGAEAQVADGLRTWLEAWQAGLRPDPVLWVDKWAEQHMRIPREAGAEPGKYRVARTPFAREVMQALSPAHPARRVVAMVASQLFKTQVGLNWIGACIAAAPGNILVLLPTLALAKRVSSRIGKTIGEVPVLREVVAQPRSRDARNTIDTKEFSGGTLYITTAGSAANLAEIPVRYLYGDEVDRWDLDVEGEGDPIELGETRGSTFGRRFKAYYTSSPTIEKASRIADLFASSDQRHFYVPCPECGHRQVLLWEQLRWEPDFSAAHYVCAGCGVLIEERHKGAMLAAGEWRADAAGDGETVGFHLSALYAPPGWVSWTGLAKQWSKAKAALDRGDPEPMQVFYNTRLARCWDDAQERTAPQELQARAEDYELRTLPRGVLALTAAVDVQGNRLEVLVIGWGEGLERWVIDYAVLVGDPADDRTWQALDEYLARPLRHVSGRDAVPLAVAVDSGGHHTQEVYAYTRMRRHRHVLAVKGAAKPGRPVIAQRPTKVDVTWRGKLERGGAELWIVGTDTAKDWIYHRLKLAQGPGGLHFSRHLPDDFYVQLTAERKLTRFVRGYRRTEWVKAKADRNEALDLMVYNFSAAQYLGLHRYRERDWQRLRDQIDPRQGDLLEESLAPAFSKVPAAAENAETMQEEKATATRPSESFIRRGSGSWLNRR